MTAHAIDDTVIALTEIDATIESTPRGALTLDPNRSRATPLSDVVGELTDSTQHRHLAAAACAVAEAQLEAFPQNLLWDFDYYLASLHAQALAAPDYGAHLREASRITVGLMRLYGQHSTIRFQYVHDFIYGFDWVRWVRRDERARSRVEPFSLEFLKQSDKRGRDLLRLIESDDELYPKLSDAGPRNPFPFVRAPDEELCLYRSLAARGCIPVEAWRVDARPDASRDFDELRGEAALRLGLAR